MSVQSSATPRCVSVADNQQRAANMQSTEEDVHRTFFSAMLGLIDPICGVLSQFYGAKWICVVNTFDSTHRLQLIRL